MNDRSPSFEAALTAAFGQLADKAVTEVDPWLVTSLVSTRPRRRFGRRILPLPRAVVLVGLAALLAIATLVALAAGTHLLDRKPPVHDPERHAIDPQPRVVDPATPVFGAFTRTGQLPTSATMGYVNAAAVLPDGRVLAVGMLSSGQQGDTWAFLYSPASGTWSATTREPLVRRLSTATTLPDGRVLIVGGYTVDDQGTPIVPAEAEVYSPTSGAFTATAGRLATPRLDHAATLLADGRVLVTGGQRDDWTGTVPPSDTAEIFDPASGLFTSVGNMSVPREGHVATLLDDGRVLITGGFSAGTSATAAAELFDARTGMFSVTGSMTAARSQHAAVKLRDGRVLVVGGSGPADVAGTRPALASAEIYDPASGTFSSTRSLATERSGPAATLLDNGTVLVAGGSNAFGGARSAEVFDPASGTFKAGGSSSTSHGTAWAGALPDGRILLLSTDDSGLNGGPELWTSIGGGASSATSPPRTQGFAVLGQGSGILRRGHAATRLRDGSVLVTGGGDPSKPSDDAMSSAELIASDARSWSELPSMHSARAHHVAVLLDDGDVFLAGGESPRCQPSGDCPLAPLTAEIFDASARTFRPLTVDLGPPGLDSIGSRRGTPAALLLRNGRVFFVGPIQASSDTRIVTVIDPVTGVATRSAPLPCTSRVSLVRLADDRVFAQCGGARRGAYVYDATGSDLEQVNSTEAWDGAIGLADGRVLVVRTHGEAAVFDPSTKIYTGTGSLAARTDNDPEGRYGEPYRPRLVLLGDGRVLAAGGGWLADLAPGGSGAAVELFDPVAGSWRPVGPMGAARLEPTATLLDDGRVLFVGGVARSPDRTDPDPAVLEIFDPNAIR